MSSAALIQRMLAARQKWITLDEAKGWKVLVQRPDSIQLSRWAGRLGENLILEAVVGWAGFQEDHLVPGGTSDELEWDATLWRVWIADNPHFWDAIIDPMMEDLRARNQIKEVTKGNSQPSSHGSGTTKKAKSPRT